MSESETAAVLFFMLPQGDFFGAADANARAGLGVVTEVLTVVMMQDEVGQGNMQVIGEIESAVLYFLSPLG